MNPAEISNIIYFHLANIIPAENGHHLFEKFCGWFGRLDLGIDFLFSTGPVARWGDGGLDFFTYGISIHGGKKIAGACSTWKNNIQRKIKKDLNKILSNNIGDPIDEFLFFYHKTIPEGIKKSVIKWILTTHGIVAEIYDGKQLADSIAAKPKLRWIASHHLSISSSLIKAKNPIFNRNINAKARYIALGSIIAIWIFVSSVMLAYDILGINKTPDSPPSQMALFFLFFLTGFFFLMYIVDEKKLFKSKMNKKDIIEIVIAIILPFIIGGFYLSYTIDYLPYPYSIIDLLLCWVGTIIFYFVLFFSLKGVKGDLRKISKKFEA